MRAVTGSEIADVIFENVPSAGITIKPSKSLLLLLLLLVLSTASLRGS